MGSKATSTVVGHLTELRPGCLAVTWSEDRKRSNMWMSGTAVVAIAAAGLVEPMLVAPVAVAAVLLSKDNWALRWEHIVACYVFVLLVIPASYNVSGGLPIDLTSDRAALGVVFLVWVVWAVDRRSRDSLRGTAADAALLLLLAYAAADVYLNVDRIVQATMMDTAIKRVLYLAGLILVYFIVSTTITRREQILAVVRAIVTAGSFAAIFGITERLLNFNPLRQLDKYVPLLAVNKSSIVIQGEMLRGAANRVYGSAEHPIVFGATMAIILPLACYLLISSEGGSQRLIWGASCVLLTLGMFFSVSRSSIVGLCAAAFVMVLLAKKQAPRVIALALVLLFAVHLAFPGLLGTFRKMLDPEYILQAEMTATSGRMLDYPAVYKEISEKPAFGMGFELFDTQRFFHLDNQYLKFILELGFLGLALVAYCFLALLRAPLLLARKNSSGELTLEVVLLSSIVFYIVAGAFFDTIGFVQITSLFFLIAALAMSLAREASMNGERTAPSGLGRRMVRFRIVSSEGNDL